VSQSIFTTPDLTVFAGLDQLGLVATGQCITKREAVIACDVVAADDYCQTCGSRARPIGTVKRQLSHEPFGARPTVLHVRIRRYRCDACARVWRQDTSQAAEPRAKLTRTALSWGLHALVVDHRSVLSICRDLRLSWNATNAAILAEGQRRLIDDPTRFDGVRVIGVDEHVWRHVRGRDKYVTVIIDATPVADGTGSSRLLDMVEGRSKEVFASWLQAQTQDFRDRVEVVAMDGFTGFKTAAVQQLPDAVEVLDPFHVVKLGADAVTKCRQRLQQQVFGHRGRAGEPLFRIRKLLLKGVDLLTDKQSRRVHEVLADERFLALRITWEAYQQLRSIYHQPTPEKAKTALTRLLERLKTSIPDGLRELRTLARTITKRAEDIAAYFDHPRTSNGPTEAINGRIEHLRGIALGFRSLAHYIARSLLETGGFRNQLLHPQL
jgi:transposase